MSKIERVVIRCADGAVGEYAAAFSGKKSHRGEVLTVAPALIGQDADYREAIYDR
jgi:hypothetical protein